MTCPSNPPPPDGYAVWQGPVPQPLTQWAVDLRSGGALGPTHPYGTMWTRDWNGTAVIARKDYHTWTYTKEGLQQGLCIPGLTLYAPLASRTLYEEPSGEGGAAANLPPGQFDGRGILASGLALVGVLGLFYLAVKFLPGKAG